MRVRLIASERLRELAQYWNRKRGSHLMPSRGDIDPTEIPRLLPHLRMVDVLYEPDLKFRYRLVGTAVVELMGIDITGRYIDESLFDANTAKAFAGHAFSVRERAAATGVTRGRWPTNDWMIVRWVVLPLGRDRQTVDRLLIGNDAVPADEIGAIAEGLDHDPLAGPRRIEFD